jgi:diguanylate cyclase (GGDEF)-like protein/PAS domain S-box-containing protein
VCQDGVVIEANKASALMFGLEESELKMQELANLIGAENWSRLLELMETGTKHAIEIEVSFKDQIHFLEIHAHCNQEDEDKIIILAIRDISERIIAMHRLQRVANYDALTGLANRAMFERQVKRDLIDASVDNMHALLFMDLDGFKTVNDTLGHTAGDLLLYEVAQRCSEVIRASDLIARIGGDEFMIWARNIQHQDEAEKVAVQILNEMKAPFNINEKLISISFSIGIAVYPEYGTDFSVLSSHSDHAMYQAKSAGKNTFKYYE